MFSEIFHSTIEKYSKIEVGHLRDLSLEFDAFCLVKFYGIK